MANVIIRVGYKSAAWFTANPTVVLEEGQIVYRSSDGKYKIGDGTTALSGLTFYGGVGGTGDALTTNPLSQFASTTSAQLSGVISDETGSGALVFGTSPTFTTNTTVNQTTEPQYLLTVNGSSTVKARFGMVAGLYYLYGDDASAFSIYTNQVIRQTISATGLFTFAPGSSSSGSVTNYTFTNPNHTGQTLGTAVSGWSYGSFSRTWTNSGTTTIATQKENDWGIVTYGMSGTGTLTFTDAYGNFFNRPTASGVTITNPWAIGTNGAVKISVGSSGASINFAAGNGTTIALESNTTNYLNFISADANLSGFIWGAPSDAFGAFIRWSYSGQKLQIATASSGHSIEFLTDNGTSVWSISSAGVLTAVDAKNMAFGTSTGTKIGTATSQKIGFWNATPIVQPTTAVAAGTLVSNGGTTLTSTDTIDGYTLLQVVKALRNTGLLA